MHNILFIGDSLIEWGNWDVLLPHRRIINRGRAGETTGELAGRLFAELRAAGEIETLFIVSGTNDFLMGDYYFPEIYKTMLPRISLMAPSIKVVVNSLFPYRVPGVSLADTAAVNAELATVVQASGYVFLDVLHRLAAAKGEIFSPDGVHLGDEGYLRWAGEIEECLKANQGAQG